MRLISCFLVCLSLQPAFAKSSEFGLELWLFHPKAELPAIDETRQRGGETHRWGPFIAELGTVTEKSRISGLHFNDDSLTIDSIHSDIGLSSFVGKSSVGFGRRITLYRIYNVGFVSHSRHPFTFRAPSRLDLRILANGHVDFRNRDSLVAYFQSQVDNVLADGNWDANFTYFYRGLPKYALYLGDKVFQARRADILAMARQEVKNRFAEPAFLDRILEQIASTLPPLQSREFEGFDAVLEQMPAGWRFRPALFEGELSPGATASIVPALAAGETNRATLVVRSEALRAQFANFLSAVLRGSQDIPELPPGLALHAQLPALVYETDEQEGAALKNFFADYAAGLDAASYRYGVFIGGANAPKLALCRDSRKSATYLDLQASFLLEANGGDRTIPLVMRFQLEGASTTLKLIDLRKPGAEPQPKPQDVKSFEALAAKMKFLVLQSLVNKKLDEALRLAKDALRPQVEIKGLRMLGDTATKCDSQTSEAEAIALDFAAN